MKSKIIVSVLLLGLQINCVNAGLDWTTVHSRANCINNESITWWYLHPYDWRVVSIHHDRFSNVQHAMDTGYSSTWRQHAIHWAEPMYQGPTWEVWGYHYLKGFHDRTPFAETYATDCSIIDGW